MAFADPWLSRQSTILKTPRGNGGIGGVSLIELGGL
jgi:hypothetical protein